MSSSIKPDEVWVSCNVDPHYEIATTYPHRIRVKGSQYTELPILIGKKLAYVLSGKKLLHHRIVAIQFVPNPDNKPLVNHIDGNIKNNDFHNLRWVDYDPNFKSSSTKAIQLTKTMRPLDEYENIRINNIWIDLQTKEAFIFMNNSFKRMNSFTSPNGLCIKTVHNQRILIDKAINEIMNYNPIVEKVITSSQHNEIDYIQCLPFHANVITHFKDYELSPLYWFDVKLEKIIKQNDKDDFMKYRYIRSQTMKLNLYNCGCIKVNVEELIDFVKHKNDDEQIKQ